MKAGEGRPVNDEPRVETHDLELRGRRHLLPHDRAGTGDAAAPADKPTAPLVEDESQSVLSLSLRLKGDAMAKGVKVTVTAAKADEPTPSDMPSSPASASSLAPASPGPGPWSNAFAMAVGSILGAVLLGKLKGEPWADDLIDWVLAVALLACKLAGHWVPAFLQ
jgi:hypothetical protein